MTKLSVLADIHGNLPALEAIITDMAQFNVDQVVVAGDVINLCPFSKEVIERIFSLNWVTIRGNHEMYLLDYDTPQCPPAWKTFDNIRLLSQQLNGHWLDTLATLPDTLSLRFQDAPPVRVIHASSDSITDNIFPATLEEEILEKLAGIEENTVIFGHTHLITDRHVGRWHIMNPGSAGVPSDGIRKASYMILDGDENGWHATIRRVDFDYAPIFAEYKRQDFIGQCGVFGYLFIEELKTARHHYMPYTRWHAANYPDEAHSITRAQEFVDSSQLWNYSIPARRINWEQHL